MCNRNGNRQITTDHLDATIMFATRDRAAQLRRTLSAYLELDTRGIRWELVVIDNNSTDETDTVLRQAPAALPLIRLFVSAPGQNRARNRALAHLRGDLVVFTDDDVLPDPHCLRAYLQATRRWPDEAIFGARIDPEFPPATPAWMRDPAFGFSTTAFARYHPADREGPVTRHPYGPSFAVRRHALRGQRFSEHLGPQSGGYAMGGEGDFLRRVAGDSYRFIYVPDARVRHIVRADQITPEWLFSRARNKGRGQVYMPSSKKPSRVHVRGVPLKLWLGVCRSWIRCQWSRAVGTPACYMRHRIRFELRYGEARERCGNNRGCLQPKEQS